MQPNPSTLSDQAQSHIRVINSLLGKMEKKALLWLAARMPAWVVPDTLSALGLFAALMIFMGYALTFYDKAFLWLASLGFVLNWFGDSLDGTLARYRKIERPRYGFFIDHIIDAVSEVLIFIGIGLSPFVQFELALGALVVYLLLSIFVYLGTYVNGVFRISYAGLGPTETRVLAILANTFVFFTNNQMFAIGQFQLTLYDLLAILMIIVGSLIFMVSSILMARDLSREDRVARVAKIQEERAIKKQEKVQRRQERINRKLAQRDLPNRRRMDDPPTGQVKQKSA